MSMVVQHNMQAANANRMLGVTTSAQSKSTEKLSSGYKINRAADDAAGLTILIIESSLNSRFAGYYVFSSGNPFPEVVSYCTTSAVRHKHL